MGYRYIALVDADAPREKASSWPAQEAALGGIGMRHRLTHGQISLFASEGTPTLMLPGGAVIVGHLFCKDGSPAGSSFSDLPHDKPLGKHLLEHYWGEYLLIQPMNSHERRVEILRDPSGGVPCAYGLQDGRTFVTSDISLAEGLGLFNRQVDWGFIAQTLRSPHLKTQRTGLLGIRELQPGFSLVLQGTKATIRQDWSPWRFVAPAYRHDDPDIAAAQIHKTVATVVKAWAGVDQTILLELSGGLDSSIIATCLRETGARIACCTLVSPVPGADERLYAAQAAECLGVDLQAESLDLDNAFFDIAPPPSAVTPRVTALQHAIDQAIGTAAARNRVSSLFSGGGGDTVFCYLASAAPAADAFRERGFAAGISAIAGLSTLHQCTLWKASRLTLRKLLREPKPLWMPDDSFLTPATSDAPPEPHPWFAAPADALPGDRERITELAGTQVFRDGAPRGNSRWLRLPLLSQPVMEACLRVPSWMWIAQGENRAVARAAFSDLLPPDILRRRSKGDFLNYTGAVYRRHQDRIREFLLGGQLQKHGLLDTAALQCFFATVPRPRDSSFLRIFDLCMVENWVRHQV
ncbi:Asparagine synthetase [glutamine-hydrolyzing] [plant metagenome]